jgi:hypothetical protein
MVNSLFAIADYLSRFPHDMLPETTEERVGFVHPYTGGLEVEKSSLEDFVTRF